jgi:hypothetical protein
VATESCLQRQHLHAALPVLFFADANYFRGELNELVKGAPEPPELVVLDAGAISQSDTDGAATLIELAEELRSRGARLVLAHVEPPVLELWRRAGVVDGDASGTCSRRCEPPSTRANRRLPVHPGGAGSTRKPARSADPSSAFPGGARIRRCVSLRGAPNLERDRWPQGRAARLPAAAGSWRACG